MSEESVRMTGRVKWFHKQKGYGFIEADDGEGDVFIHYTDIPGDGFRSLEVGQKIEFEMIENDKGTQAKRVKILTYPVKKQPNEFMVTVKVPFKQLSGLSETTGISLEKLVYDVFSLAAKECLFQTGVIERSCHEQGSPTVSGE
jgi:CspA family cold shock protein